MDTLYKTRRDNLHRLVLDRFDGNKAALARATDVHPNHINLLLSVNPKYTRNLGEDLARKMEASLGLPATWLDSPQEGAPNATRSIPAHPIDSSLSAVLRPSSITMLTVTDNWLASSVPEITAPENIFTASLASDALAPTANIGDIVLVDGGVKAFAGDGTYLLVSKVGAFVRHVKRSVTGSYVLNTGSESETLASLKGLSVVGRILRRIPLERL